MHRAIAYRLVDYDIPIANLDVIQAIGIGAHPGLKLYRGPLAAKVRQGHKISGTTLPTSRKHEFHAHLPFLQLRVSAVHHSLNADDALRLDRSTRGSFHHVTHCFLKARLLPLPLYHTHFLDDIGPSGPPAILGHWSSSIRNSWPGRLLNRYQNQGCLIYCCLS
jgi:hypothetical protein